jgi:surface polysaccharide O-acyltransferase-like enzyme
MKMSNWPNLIRFTAILLVIVLHVSAEVSVEFQNISKDDWIISIFYNSISRCCVPLFVMLSGGLILSNEISLINYIKKRFIRIFFPWLFWSIIFIFLTIYSAFRRNELLNINKVFNIVFNGIVNGSSYHLWYIYMLIGLLLFLPIISGWIKSAKDIDLVYFLTIWFFVVCLKWSGVSLIPYHLFYFSDYLGYLVLGFVITKNKIPSFFTPRIIFIITVISFLITLILTIIYSFYLGLFVEKYFDYLAPNVVIYSVGVFYLLKNYNIKNTNWFYKIVESISDLSFGIYFIHVLFIYFIFKLIIPSDFHVLFSIPLISLLILTVSFFSIKLMRLLPFSKFYVG